jgi:transcriptional regulator with XRE-family HTH domain
MIHKKILDAAESYPGASMEEIADGIGGASTELVERVLDQYGDPAGDEGDGTGAESRDGQDTTEIQADQNMDRHDSRNEPGEGSSTGDTPEPDRSMDENWRTDENHTELTEKQLKTLRLIERDPDASQSEIAEEFDVTRATISRWLNDIPGFRWGRRDEIASEILNGGEIPETDGTKDPETDGSEGVEGLGALHERLDALEERIERMDDSPAAESPGIGPELAHKVVHASMKSDLITEEEELQLLRELMD